MNKKRKGFTLVELLVVIAILAILATVSVVGYLSFTEKANKSVDEQLCTQYNNLLAGEAVENKDISLGEFIILAEENGINSNQFNTTSKSYAFAYDKKNLKTVLLDKNSGEVLFPANYTNDNDLWTIYPDNNIPQNGVSNYTLLNSIVFDNNSLSGVKNIKIDLNGYPMQVKSVSTPIDVVDFVSTEEKKGTIVFSDNVASNNVKYDSNSIEIVDEKNWGAIISSTTGFDLSKYGTINEKVLTITDKYFSSSKKVDLYLTISKDGIDKIIFNNCTFSGLVLTTKKDISYELNNCVIKNTQKGYPITVAKGTKEFTFKNSSILNSIRGINLEIGTKAIIEGSTFNLNQITTNKLERKDNAIQLNSQDKKGSIPNPDITIKNNVIEKANSFIQLHANFVADGKEYTPIIDRGTYIDHLNKMKSDYYKISGNKLSEGINIVQPDPGIITDYKDYSDYDTWEELNKNLNELCDAIEGIVE